MGGGGVGMQRPHKEDEIFMITVLQDASIEPHVCWWRWFRLLLLILTPVPAVLVVVVGNSNNMDSVWSCGTGISMASMGIRISVVMVVAAFKVMALLLARIIVSTTKPLLFGFI